MDRIAELRIFVGVATARSFVAVARAQGRSPQAVTRAVGALEARLHTRLLHRTTRAVSVTSDGERYLAQARRVLAEVDALDDDAAATTLAGRIAITAPVLFGQLHVAPLVTEFLAAHPELDARLALYDRVVSLADEGIDLAIRIGELPDSALRVRLVGHVRRLACASPAYLARRGTPRTLDALARHATIGFTGTSPIDDRWTFRVAGKRERTIVVRPRLVTNTGRAAIDAAVADLGIVRVLSYQVADLVAAGALRIVLARHEPPPIPVHLVQLPGIQARAAVAFAEFVMPRLAARLDSGIVAAWPDRTRRNRSS